MNCYLIQDEHSGSVAIVDPGAEAQRILGALGQAEPCCILLTHGHPDHTGALHDIQQATGVPVGIHPADANVFQIEGDFPLLDGMEVAVGQGLVRVSHAPGHTPGSVCLRLDGEALVGDVIFPGGPGHTGSHLALRQSLRSLSVTVFTWADETVLHPGHGPSTTVGAERRAFEAFMISEHPADLHGDVSWR
jgi:glyoxylase-like metal-dependent hydrolase (beta-lactamase superfamily II)